MDDISNNMVWFGTVEEAIVNNCDHRCVVKYGESDRIDLHRSQITVTSMEWRDIE